MDRAMAGDQASLVSQMFNTARVPETRAPSTSQAQPDFDEFNRRQTEYVTIIYITPPYRLNIKTMSFLTNCNRLTSEFERFRRS